MFRDINGKVLGLSSIDNMTSEVGEIEYLVFNDDKYDFYNEDMDKNIDGILQNAIELPKSSFEIIKYLGDGKVLMSIKRTYGYVYRY